MVAARSAEKRSWTKPRTRTHQRTTVRHAAPHESSLGYRTARGHPVGNFVEQPLLPFISPTSLHQAKKNISLLIDQTTLDRASVLATANCKVRQKVPRGLAASSCASPVLTIPCAIKPYPSCSYTKPAICGPLFQRDVQPKF